MSDAELERRGIMRFEMPKLKLERDDFSIEATVPGDTRAWFKAQLSGEGVLDVTHLDNGALPDGTGSKILVQALKGHGVVPVKRLVFSDVINKPTRRKLLAGASPETTLLGKCGMKALKELGITPTSCRVENVGDKLNMIFELK